MTEKFSGLIQSVSAVGFNRAASRYLNQYQESVQSYSDVGDIKLVTRCKLVKAYCFYQQNFKQNPKTT